MKGGRGKFCGLAIPKKIIKGEPTLRENDE
jgi:hypothetical protein